MVLDAVDPSALRLSFQRSASVPSRSVMREARSHHVGVESRTYGLRTHLGIVRQETHPTKRATRLSVGRCAPGRRRAGGLGRQGSGSGVQSGALRCDAWSGRRLSSASAPLACHLPGSRVEHVFAGGQARATRRPWQPRQARTLRRRGIVGRGGARKPRSEGGLLVSGRSWRGMVDCEG